MSNPKFLKIPPKKQISFRINENTYNDFKNYAQARGLNQTEAGAEILERFFHNKIVTNDYLEDMGGLSFKIPLHIEYKKECINSKVVLNADNPSNIIGEDTTTVKINQIPNNLDVITSDGYKANKDNVLHSGIDFILIKEVLKEPITLSRHKLDIDVMDCLYCFYFEVAPDKTTNVYLINPIEAVNKLSSVNNKNMGNKLIEVIGMLEDLETQTNSDYNATMENLFSNNKYVSNKKQWECVKVAFLNLGMYFPSYDNENINLGLIAPNKITDWLI